MAAALPPGRRLAWIRLRLCGDSDCDCDCDCGGGGERSPAGASSEAESSNDVAPSDSSAEVEVEVDVDVDVDVDVEVEVLAPGQALPVRDEPGEECEERSPTAASGAESSKGSRARRRG